MTDGQPRSAGAGEAREVGACEVGPACAGGGGGGAAAACLADAAAAGQRMPAAGLRMTADVRLPVAPVVALGQWVVACGADPTS